MGKINEKLAFYQRLKDYLYFKLVWFFINWSYCNAWTEVCFNSEKNNWFRNDWLEISMQVL